MYNQSDSVVKSVVSSEKCTSATYLNLTRSPVGVALSLNTLPYKLGPCCKYTIRLPL